MSTPTFQAVAAAITPPSAPLPPALRPEVSSPPTATADVAGGRGNRFAPGRITPVEHRAQEGIVSAFARLYERFPEDAADPFYDQPAPLLPPGPWSRGTHRITGKVAVYAGPHEVACAGGTTRSPEEAFAVATAIAAIPEMVDLLTEWFATSADTLDLYMRTDALLTRLAAGGREQAL